METERSEAARKLVAGRKRQIVKCVRCMTEFETYAKGIVGYYCSNRCRQQAYRENHLEQERERQREQARKRRAAQRGGE